MNATNKLIFKTAAYAFVGVSVTFCYALALFALCAPGVMADMAESMGNRSLGAIYTAREYENNKTPENLYMAFYKSIAAGDKKMIRKYGAKFYELSSAKRDEITNKVDDYLRAAANGNVDIIAAINNYPTAKMLATEYKKVTGIDHG